MFPSPFRSILPAQILGGEVLVSSSYVVLARKWRPAQFTDIVGQTHIVRTLMNTIRSERVHQAYLFTGSRGIGKTSIARIFAKAIRCPNTVDDGTSYQSCGECPSCKEITGGQSVDVQEIDGASNNGVDAIREIRESAKYLPATGDKKIYIIDEVHMLTTAAFNALLKTLEEPPAHVIFVFATTEPHKIPATILSRCQRFDFKRVTIAQIQKRLNEVLTAEKIEFEAGALGLIARAAEGSMRDALSLLDQVISYSGDKITAESVRESVGLIESQTLLEIVRGIFEKKPLIAVEKVGEAYQQGHDLRILTKTLIEYMHAAILAKVGSPSSQALEIADEEWNELKDLAETRSLEEMELIFQVLHQGMDWVARTNQPKVVLDVLLIKCATADALVTIDPNGGSKQRSAPQPQAQSFTPAPQMNMPRGNPTPQGGRAHFSAMAKRLQTAPEIQAQPVVQPQRPVAQAKPTLAAVQAPNNEPKTWAGFVMFIKKQRPLLASLLEHANESELPSPNNDHQFKVFFSPDQTHQREQLLSPSYRNQLNTLADAFFGNQVSVQFLEKETNVESIAAKRVREEKEKKEIAETAVKNHPVIQEAKALFGGTLGPIQFSVESESPRR